MELPPIYKLFPFKFNAEWLLEKEFVDLVHKTWLDPMFQIEEGRHKRLLWKLQILKKQTKSWIKDFRARKLVNLISLESDIKVFIGQLEGDPSNQAVASSLRQSELDRNLILRSEEELWRIRSRALWLSSGDNNTKYFHKISNHNRIRKHIWEIYSRVWGFGQ
jgi:hypothetical protein